MKNKIDRNEEYIYAYEQYKEETGFSKKDFDNDISVYGYNYIRYYRDRRREVEASYCNYNFDPEGL